MRQKASQTAPTSSRSFRAAASRRIRLQRQKPFPSQRANPQSALRQTEEEMNYLRTAMLLAGLTALFMGVGYLIGGGTGALVALVIAAGMNLFSYWNSDRMVLSMHGAQEIDARAAPDLYALVQTL